MSEFVSTTNEVIFAVIRPTGVLIDAARKSFQEAAASVGADFKYIKITEEIFKEDFAKKFMKKSVSFPQRFVT